MKFSNYTSSITLDDRRSLLFNAFTYSFVVINDAHFDIRNTTPEKIHKDSHQLYKHLTEAGIIIDDSVNELLLLQQMIKDTDDNASDYIIHINPTLDCNFNCWYCYENHIPQSRMDAYTLSATKSFISKTLNNKQIKTLELGFFGGEPIMYFRKIAQEIISHANDICVKNGQNLNVHFTSNGSLISDEQIEFLSEYSCGFQITLDGNPNSHNATRFYKNGLGSYEIIIKNILKLINADINVIVRVNYTCDNINGLTAILDSFIDIPDRLKEFIRFDFQQVWQDKVKNDTDEKIRMIRNLFSSHGFTVLTNYLPQHVRNSCYGDKTNHVLINYQGDLFGCTARDFTKENRIGYLDNQGNAHYNKEKMHIRSIAKLGKEICKKCRIAPLCAGGCRQKASEALDYEGCTMGYSKDDIDNKILDIFEYEFMSEVQS